MRVTVFDADTLMWAVAYNNREESTPDKMYVSIDNMLRLALNNTKADMYCGFIQGRDNSHRHKLFKSYKANRPPRPEWFTKWKPAIEAYLTDPFGKWKFEFVEGMEVDDAVASVVAVIEDQNERLECKENCTFPIICSIDKDLRQIAGEHYNPEKKETTHVTADEANYALCKQLLMGDSIDGIKGLKGIGKAKSGKILENIAPQDMIHEVLNTYVRANAGFNGELARGVLEFAENAMQIVLKQDINFKFTLHRYVKGVEA